MQDRGDCKICDMKNVHLDEAGRCYFYCHSYISEGEIRCPKCGGKSEYEVSDYEGEDYHDVNCPLCGYEFVVEIEVECIFNLNSPPRIVEE
jgi:hypothetical protein